MLLIPPLISHLTISLLMLRITLHRSPNTPQRTHNPTGDAFTPVRYHILGLLRLSRRVLLLAGFPQVFVAQQVAEGFLGGADGLVPCSAGFVLQVSLVRCLWLSSFKT